MEDLYFYIGFDSKQQGPMSIDEIIAKGITKSTLVWKDGMKDWVEAYTIPQFASRFDKQSDKATSDNTLSTDSTTDNNTINKSNQPDYKYSPTILPLAILCSIFCCTPFGIVAIVYSAIAKSLWRQGKIEEGNHAHSIANKWIIWSIVAWLSVILFIVITQTAIFALFASFIQNAHSSHPSF